MKCAYCGNETKGTKEHIVSCGILDLFPECYLTFDNERGIVHQADPMVKDVCAECNNKRITYIDSYAKRFVAQYFTKKYSEKDTLEIEYDYVLIQKMLLKYAFNDLRAHRLDCSYFDEEILHFLMNESDNSPKRYVSVLCGLAVNVSPVPDTFWGNMKIQWSRNPIFYSNSVIRSIDYETGKFSFNDSTKKETFPDLCISYVFRFNSVQFVLMCWDKTSNRIEESNVILGNQYPYSLLTNSNPKVSLPICTNEINYHQFEQIHVKWDGLNEIGTMRKLASGGKYSYKENFEKEWAKEEQVLRDEHPRK